MTAMTYATCPSPVFPVPPVMEKLQKQLSITLGTHTYENFIGQKTKRQFVAHGGR